MADVPGDGVLLFGGQHGTPPGTALTDVWSFSTEGGWGEEIADTGVSADGFAFDTQSGLAVVVEQDGTWTYDPAAGTWNQLETAERPGRVWGARLAYDAGSDRVILFGGFDGGSTLSDQTWALDVDAQLWQRMAPAISPPAQNFHALSYDPVADRVLLFSTTEADGSTWAYDYDTDTWTDLAPTTGPAQRIYTAMAYDAVGQRTILFGGVDPIERPFGDTWAYDSAANTWTDLDPSAAPSPRGWHAMAYDAEAERIVLFSGGETRDTDLADAWLFDPHTDTWSQAD